MTLLDSFSPSLLCKNDTTMSMMKCAIGNPKRGKDRESLFFLQEKSEFELKNTPRERISAIECTSFWCVLSLLLPSPCSAWFGTRNTRTKKNGSRH